MQATLLQVAADRLGNGHHPVREQVQHPAQQGPDRGLVVVVAAALGDDQTGARRSDVRELGVDIGGAEEGHGHVEATGPQHPCKPGHNCSRTGALFVLLVHRNLLLIEARTEKIIARKVDEHFHGVAAASQSARQLHDLTLRTAGAEMIDDQQDPHDSADSARRWHHQK